ncbi:MAG TPA: hypothetical protein VFK88_13170 [Gallionella sp.]|nr:hypothetical protein [Gallionella sp.]
MKKILGIVGVLVVAAVIAYFTLSNPLGRLVKLGIESFGPDMLQADVRVSSVHISTSDGAGKLSGLMIGNPKGFKTDHALKADAIEIALEPASITEDVIVLHKVVIDAPNIIYEKGDQGTNFDAIQHNVEAYLGAGKGKKDESGKSKKFIIDSFVIRNAKVNYNDVVDLSLPDIELHNIGKKSGGATSAQVARAIIAELNAKLALALAKTAVVTGVGGVAVGAGMAMKSLFGK